MIGILILIAFGSVVAGVMIAFLLFNISQRNQRKRQAEFQKKANLITTGPTKQPGATTVKVGINKPNRRKEDTLEILLKNHKNAITSENHNQSSMTNVPREAQIVSQKNIAVVVEPKKSSMASASVELETLKQENTLAREKPKQSPVPDVSREPEIINPKIPSMDIRPNESPQSDIIKELKTNLAIATTPWSDKLLPFQTSSWDISHGEGETLLTPFVQEMIQLYVDIGLANNIVWLATEIGHRSKDLDESYVKLCTNIAERIKKIMSLLNGIE